MTSIYLASPWVNREATRVIRDHLVAAGHEITSRWLNTPDGPQVPDEDRGRREAAWDFEDIAKADMLIVLSDDKPIGAGYHVEFGYALALGKRIILVGPVKSIFHYLADARYDT